MGGSVVQEIEKRGGERRAADTGGEGGMEPRGRTVQLSNEHA